MVDFPAKRSATEDKVLPSTSGDKPYNQGSVDDEVTTRLQNVPREIRKSVTEGYRTPLALPRPADKDLPIFRSHRDDLVWTLDLISPQTVREKELRPLYERLERAGPEAAGEGKLFAMPGFPGRSGEKKRRMERETSPSSSAGNSPVMSPVGGGMELDALAGEDLDVDMDAPVPLPAPALLTPQVQAPLGREGREIRPRPRRSMKNVQSAPAGGLKFGGGSWPPAGEGQTGLADVDDEPWREVDFSAFAQQVPE
ncbi:hypothetical protein CALCODRAFT_83442 [Calocera cornea HHB12733]|uniref:Uncharacterized protein n=1 Tax=Calocera cornea HHB12733 TaxID=1353952 RepID=A0A165IL69_9BASI|nr:hypothetical protein CALCODRAFT_83442 [Calocera cornea HHB12733]